MIRDSEFVEGRTACRPVGVFHAKRGAAPLGSTRLRFSESPITNHESPHFKGFTLLELLVALAVFAALAAAAYGGLAQVARTRAALAAQQDRLAAVTRAVGMLERDLRQTLARPVRGNAANAVLPALAGRADGVELTRLGFANPRAEPRSHLERVVYAQDGARLRRGRYAVLDRVPGSVPDTATLLDAVESLRLRYVGRDGVWRESWPPADGVLADLPRAVEFRLGLADLGEIRRVLELPASLPAAASNPPGGDGAPDRGAP